MIFLDDFLRGKRRGPGTVTVAFTINAVAIISIGDAIAVSVIAPPVRGGGPGTSGWGPGAAPPAVAVPVTVAVPFMVPVAFIPSARATGAFAFAFTARRGASFVAPNGRGGIFGPLISRVGLAEMTCKANTDLDAQSAALKVASMPAPRCLLSKGDQDWEAITHIS